MIKITHKNCEHYGYEWDNHGGRFRKKQPLTDGVMIMSWAEWQRWGYERYYVMELKIWNFDKKQLRGYVLWSPCFPSKKKIYLRGVTGETKDMSIEEIEEHFTHKRKNKKTWIST